MVQAALMRKGRRDLPKPVNRRLRGYAFDPSLSTQLETALVNQIVFKVRWEEDLQPGPTGEYVEIIDWDPASGVLYEPVDLNHPTILAEDGLAPSEGNPQYHQQMVYSVVMTTIRNFERALGRKAFWSPNIPPNGGDHKPGKGDLDDFVGQLRIYPHALRQANAYYSPTKKALLFGYFPATADDPGNQFPGGTIFTCLSHDIIAHETTHALLDGLHRRFTEPTNVDALAFHEAFADIVALFQHFSFPDVLKHQIAQTRGNLSSQNLLGQLAQQFGQAIGRYGALRDAIGQVNKQTKQWEPHVPDPEKYQTELEPHSRGSLLVAAVFDAFLAIYRKRIADLLRIATGGTGILDDGELHPDLVNRLADEASKSAQHVLNMCIRALDYCPPVGLNFGNYLRAIITADTDLVPDDDLGYRIAITEGFRRRGIYPLDIRTLSIDSLSWPSFAPDSSEANLFNDILDRSNPEYTEALRNLLLRPRAGSTKKHEQAEDRYTEREWTYILSKRACRSLHDMIDNLDDVADFERITGLVLKRTPENDKRWDIQPSQKGDKYRFEVNSIRRARRATPDGDQLSQIIMTITQRRRFDRDIPYGQSQTYFRGGCTLILDFNARLDLRYAIRKFITDDERFKMQQSFMQDGFAHSLTATYFNIENEPFAFLHSSDEG